MDPVAANVGRVIRADQERSGQIDERDIERPGEVKDFQIVLDVPVADKFDDIAHPTQDGDFFEFRQIPGDKMVETAGDQRRQAQHHRDDAPLPAVTDDAGIELRKFRQRRMRDFGIVRILADSLPRKITIISTELQQRDILRLHRRDVPVKHFPPCGNGAAEAGVVVEFDTQRIFTEFQETFGKKGIFDSRSVFKDRSFENGIAESKDFFQVFHIIKV